MTVHNPLSTRITTINNGDTDGWDLFRRARDMKRAGHPVIELTIGEHDIRTAAPILREMHQAAIGGNTGYADIPGSDELRDTIARRIQSNTGVATSRDNILVTAGGQAALFAAHHAVCDEGDKALYVDPYYATYTGTIRSVGANPVAVYAQPEDGFQLKRSALEAQAQGARSLLINTPNNPTGVVYSRETIQDIAEVCKAHGLWLISDEVYDTQIWEGTHISPRQIEGMAERTMVVGSMSKSHAMTGSRVGWVCGPAHAIARIEDLLTYTNYGIAGYIQDAANYALQLGKDFEDQIGAPFKRRRAIVEELLAGQNIVRAVPMQGAMYAMLDIRATGMSGEEFADALLDEKFVAVMPGESFGTSSAGHVRVALTVDDVAFRSAFETLLSFAAERA